MKKSSSTKHHEESHTFQEKYYNAVKKIYNSLSQHGNPFKDCSEELINIKSSDVMNNDVVASIQSLSAVGEDLHKQYVKNVISGKTSITETLSKVGFFLFSSQHRKGQTKQQTETALLKQNLQLANKLWMTASIRGNT